MTTGTCTFDSVFSTGYTAKRGAEEFAFSPVGEEFHPVFYVTATGRSDAAE